MTKIVQTERKKPSLLEIFAEVQPILYKIASKIKANLELYKSLDDFSVMSTLFGNLEVLVMYIADGDGIAAKVHHKLAVTQYAYHIAFLSS